MNIKEKYELLNRFNLICETLDTFKQRVLQGKHGECDDEAYSEGVWDLAGEIANNIVPYELQDKYDYDLLQDLLYNLLKY